MAYLGNGRWQPPSRWTRFKRQVRNIVGTAFWGAVAAVVISFVGLLFLWPFISGGTILYVIVHFVRKIW